jgi:hypothetical protein
MDFATLQFRILGAGGDGGPGVSADKVALFQRVVSGIRFTPRALFRPPLTGYTDTQTKWLPEECQPKGVQNEWRRAFPSRPW